MLAKRIIPCLDVKGGRVVKGIRFRNHEIVGEIGALALRYRDQGADELVFYDIAASTEERTIGAEAVRAVARVLDIPFCVAGGIRTLADAAAILENGADKISINSPALERPALIGELAAVFGSQCIVAGVDSFFDGRDYIVHQYTGDPDKSRATPRRTQDWLREVQDRGAGEIVLNCMNRDGVRTGYDLDQLAAMGRAVSVPLVASGGAGAREHFRDVFTRAGVDAALAASVFHKAEISIPKLKEYLACEGVEVRI